LAGRCGADFLINLHHKTSITWRYFFELVIATRFAWLSGWLNKKDFEMVELELDYLNLLVEHDDLLKNTWQVTT